MGSSLNSILNESLLSKKEIYREYYVKAILLNGVWIIVNVIMTMLKADDN